MLTERGSIRFEPDLRHFLDVFIARTKTIALYELFHLKINPLTLRTFLVIDFLAKFPFLGSVINWRQFFFIDLFRRSESDLQRRRMTLACKLSSKTQDFLRRQM